MDWQGLLKWTLTHHGTLKKHLLYVLYLIILFCHLDGTKKKDIKEMDEETKKWLMEALAENAL